jgi:hypothetical protein
VTKKLRTTNKRFQAYKQDIPWCISNAGFDIIVKLGRALQLLKSYTGVYFINQCLHEMKGTYISCSKQKCEEALKPLAA